jgi:hypothetical protein
MMTSVLIGGALIVAAITSAQAQTGPSSGMIVYIDPQTGAILPAPAPGTLPLQFSPAELNAARTDHEGLVEAPSSGPAGGVSLNLQGRFQNPLVGTIDANGNAKVQHLPVTPK